MSQALDQSVRITVAETPVIVTEALDVLLTRNERKKFRAQYDHDRKAAPKMIVDRTQE